jgi:LmbE family N-acetylglucosaminyl deacetylase
MNRAFSLIPSRPCRALACASLLLALALPLAAQLTPQNDPANLAGERVSPPDLADTLPINHGAPALEQLLRKLRTRASFMLIVAHPDDEDGGLLTYLSRGQGARVAMLTLNRGEGGQNLMSADFDDALGLIRTQELLAADRYMGVDQFFGTEVDFGFSKTKEEAFAKWTHDRVLYDAVRAVRLYRPLVIASVFIGAPSDGHGQHQVSGEIAQEVFNAAGDPNVFPDQIAAGLQPWQPLKVYARSPFGRIDAQGMYDSAISQYVPARFTNYVTGKVTTTVPKANVTIPEGATDPLLGGLSYVQFARQGLGLQKTQIGRGIRLAPAGRMDVSYHRYGSHVLGPDGKPQPDGDDSGLESSLFDGIDTSLPGIATLAPEVADKFRPLLEKIDQQIAEAQRLFSPDRLELTAPPLRLALSALDGGIHELENPSINDLPPTETYDLLHELHIKRAQLNNALVLALGLTVHAEAIHETGDVVLNSKPAIAAQFEASIKGVNPPRLREFIFTGPNETIKKSENDNLSDDDCGAPIKDSTDKVTGEWIYGVGHEIKPGLNPTRPYFSRPDIEQPYYDISDPGLRNAPMTPPPFVVQTEFTCNGVPLFVNAIISKHSDSQLIQPVLAVPSVSISLDRSTAILRPGEKSVHVVATVSAEDAAQKLGGVKVLLARDSKAKPELLETALPEEYSKVIGKPENIGISVGANNIDGETSTVTAVVTQQGHDYSEGFRPVGYPGLTYTNYYTPATLRVVPVDVTTAPNLNIAYLPGTGDDVPAALDQLGVHPHLITAADLTPEALKPYDAVVLGVRAYERPELAAANPALNAYAAAGGIVIAQYNTGRLPEGTGPYPLDLGGSEKVVEEDTPVHILTPDNPLLTWPNKITAADFDHWVEERGHGFMATWDPHYAALLETHDPGQQPQLGGLLVARTGRGAWIYLGLALYRQLPEGVPGPYRLFANLISAARNPGMQK